MAGHLCQSLREKQRHACVVSQQLAAWLAVGAVARRGGGGAGREPRKSVDALAAVAHRGRNLSLYAVFLCSTAAQGVDVVRATLRNERAQRP
jgi:hypothetical protein